VGLTYLLFQSQRVSHCCLAFSANAKKPSHPVEGGGIEALLLAVLNTL